ncbi:MAG: hypothetical protein ABSB00_01340 [Minisyncoccia bacterium]|jgi:hypothetical protein
MREYLVCIRIPSVGKDKLIAWGDENVFLIRKELATDALKSLLPVLRKNPKIQKALIEQNSFSPDEYFTGRIRELEGWEIHNLSSYLNDSRSDHWSTFKI